MARGVHKASLRLQRLAILWLLSSFEVFSTARRIEWGLASVFNPRKTGGVVSQYEDKVSDHNITLLVAQHLPDKVVERTPSQNIRNADTIVWH